MKNFVLAILLFASLHFIHAQTYKEASIDIKSKAGNIAGFVGKTDENYLFFSTVPLNPGAGFDSYDPPEMHLLDKNLNLKVSYDLKKALKELDIKDTKYLTSFVFNNKPYVVIESKVKKSEYLTFTIYPLNKNNLSLELNKKIVVSDKVKGYKGKVLTSVSENKKFLAVTFAYDGDAYLSKTSELDFTYTMIFDENMKIVYEDIFGEDRNFESRINIYNQQVGNDGNLYYLNLYCGKKINSYQCVYSTNAYVSFNPTGGKPININLPDKTYLTAGGKINLATDYFLISGLPSIYEDLTYKAFGYYNQNLNKQLENTGSNTIPFIYLSESNIKLNPKKDGIEYEGAYLLEDGSFFMISHIFEGDRFANYIASNDKHLGKYIIVSYFDKNCKIKWTKSIDRNEVGYFTRINCLYRKTDNLLYIFYDSRNYKTRGIFYNTIDASGNISESKKVCDNNQYILSNTIPIENEIMLYNKEKGGLDCLSIKF